MKRLIAITLTTFGAATAAVGVGLIYLPAGVIVGGLLAGAAGLFVVDDGREPQ